MLAVPTFAYRSPNVAAVTRIGSTGIWCITFTEPISFAQRRSAVVSSGASSGYVTNQSEAFSESSCPGGVRVDAYTDVNSFTALDATFTFLIP
jgi:hypothetical protein